MDGKSRTILGVLVVLCTIRCIGAAIGDDCSASDAICDTIGNGQCSSGVCACVLGYKDDGTTNDCIPNTIGDPCALDVECTTVLANTRCDAANTCVCAVGYMQTGAVCDIIDCGPLILPTDGTAVLDGSTSTYLSTATFACNTGFSPDATLASTCQADGNWDVTTHACTIKDCGPLTLPTDGTAVLDGSTSTYLSTATFACNTGFSPDATLASTCQADGNWDVTTHACTIKDCGPLTLPTDGTAVLDGSTSTYLSTATFACNTGFSPDATLASTCQADGNWDVTTHACTIKDCGPLTLPTDGTAVLDGSTSTYLSTATFACNTGFSPDATLASTCQADGNWDVTTHACTIKDCGPLTLPTDGTAVLDGSTSTYLSTATFACNTGFSPDATLASTCQADGNWDVTTHACTIKDCGPLTLPTDGTAVLDGSTSTYLSTATFACNTGFSPDATLASTCQADGNWDVTTHACTIKDCGPLTLPTDGTAVLDGSTSTYLSTATFACNTGFSPDATLASTCQADGNWDVTTHACTIKDCGPLTLPTDGTAVLDGSTSTYLSTATFACNTGFSPDATLASTCQADGNWDVTTHACTIKDCGPLTLPTDGTAVLDGSTSTYLSTATFACNTGFSPDATLASTCQADGNWDVTTHACTIKDCGPLTLPTDGTAVLDGSTSTYLSTATFACNTGFSPDAPLASTCQADGNWDVTTHTCTIKNCGNPAPTFGSVDGSVFTYTNTVTVSCDPGYDRSGSEIIECTASGAWSENPTCAPKDCGPLTQPTDGTAVLDDSTSTYLSTTTFACNTGFSPDATLASTCQADGNWDVTTHTCTIKNCGGLGSPQNGGVDTTGGTTYLNKVTFSCDSGYLPVDPVESVCQDDATWTVATHNCDARSCGDPSPSHGTATGSFLYPTTASISCDSGYNRVGLGTISCQDTGFWSSAPTCDPVDCGDPTEPLKGRVMFTATKYRDEASFSCTTGYDLVGDEITTCEDDGKWSISQITNCRIKDCDNLPNPPNGLAVTPDGTTFGQSGTYSCHTGYVRLGDVSTVCQADGTWSPEDPLCTIKDCGQPTAPENGYVDTSQGTKFKNESTFHCNSGYDLTGDSSTICLSGAVWSQVSEPSCRIRDCRLLPDPDNGASSNPDGTTYGQEGIYSCHVGYDLMGASKSQCQADGTWSSTDPLCTIKDCGFPTIPQNGAVYTTQGRKYMDEATYSCHTGYDLTGDASTTCQSNGAWTVSAPTVCQVRSCGPSPNPTHGTTDIAQGAYGDVATFSCDSGYTLTADATTLCLDDGSWDGNMAICAIKVCGSLEDPVNGIVNMAGGTDYLSMAQFTCNSGYELSGQSSRICQADSTWSGTSPVCTIKDCPALTPPANGEIIANSGLSYGAAVTFTCADGYDRSHGNTLHCLSNGLWDGVEPTCVIRDCDVLPNPVNGLVSIPESTTYGETATFTCNTGYTLNGYPSRLCQSDRAWSNDSPICIVKVCSMLTNPNDGTVDMSNGITFGEVATYSCNMGYDIVGTMTVVCQADTSWSDPPPTCQIKDCNNPPRVNNGQVDFASGTEYQAVATYDCDTNFGLVGDAKVTCEETGTWSVEPVCLPECGGLSSPTDGTISLPDGTKFGATATYTCLPGYNLIGVTTRECLSTAQWSGSGSPTCVIKDCQPLSTIANGDVSLVDGTLYSAVAVFMCNIGYTLVGELNRQCLHTGMWSGATPTCLINDCDDLPNPVNGLVTFPQGTAYEETATFTCNTGYTLNGYPSRSCQSDRSWSNASPTCIVKLCSVLTNPNSGTVDMSNGITFGEVATYSCNMGYDMVGTMTVFCQADTSWSDPPPTCQIKDCNDPPIVSNGQVDFPSGTEYQDVAIYRCDTNFVLVGDSIVTCEETGTWSVKPVCLPDCGAPAAIVNGQYSVDGSTLMGAVATYTCNSSYRISGSSQVVCQSIGEWNEEPECVVVDTPYGTACSIDAECATPGAVCQDDGMGTKCLCFSTASNYYDVTVDACLNNCGPLSAPTNGYVATPDITAEGQIATYSCFVGYAVTGQAIRTCLSTGWSGSVPTCSIGCKVPESPLNGYVNTSYGTAAGSTISYSCKDGYSLVGEATHICLSDTTWSDKEPTCAVQCPDLVGIGHGTVDTSSGNWEGSTATFICDSDYGLVGTATRICLSSGIWTGVDPQCIFAVLPDVLVVFLVLFVFLMLIDVFVITFWIYLKYCKSKKEDKSNDMEKYPYEVETPRQQSRTQMSFKKKRNGRVGPDYPPSQPVTALHLLPPIPHKPLNRRADGAPYQTHVPKPKPIHRNRQGFRDEAVPFVPLVTSRMPPITFQQTMTDVKKQEPIEQTPDLAKDGYVTSTSEDSQQKKAPSVAEEDQVSIDQQNNSGVEADEPREPSKVMHNATTGFEVGMEFPKINRFTRKSGEYDRRDQEESEEQR